MKWPRSRGEEQGENGPERAELIRQSLILSAGEGRLMRVDSEAPTDTEPWVVVLPLKANGSEPLQILSQVDKKQPNVTHHTLFYTTFNEADMLVRRCDYFDERQDATDPNLFLRTRVARNQPINYETTYAPDEFGRDAILLHCQPGSRLYTLTVETVGGELDLPPDAAMFAEDNPAHRKLAMTLDHFNLQARLSGPTTT